MKVKIYQDISEIPTRNGDVALPLSVHWDFGRLRGGLYGSISIGILIWSLDISFGGY